MKTYITQSIKLAKVLKYGTFERLQDTYRNDSFPPREGYSYYKFTAVIDDIEVETFIQQAKDPFTSVDLAYRMVKHLP